MRQYEKTDDKRYVRDPHNTAILNTDRIGYQQFLLERKRELELRKVVNEVSILKQDISDIRNMLQQLINGKLNG